MTEPRRKLRIGLLQDSEYANRYMRDLITWAAEQDDLEISHLFIHRVPEETGYTTFRRKLAQHKLAALGKAALKVIRKLEQYVLRRYQRGRYRDHTGQARIDHLIPNTIPIRPTISKSGLVYRFGPEEIAKVRTAGCDVLVRGGAGILLGEILDVAPFGILSFHHGDNRVNRGGPPAFWESYFAWPATGFVIQRLTAELDGGDVLVRGSYETKWFFLLNQAALFTKSNIHFKDLLKKVARDRRLPPVEPPLPYSEPLYRAPSVGTCLSYALRVVGRALRKGLHNILPFRNRWYLSFSFSDWRRAVLRKALMPASPPGRFLADPFIWEYQGKTFCAAEDYSYRDRIARISIFEVSKQGITPPVTVIDEPFHLSFPFVFQFQGSTYICPECSGSKQIRLYRAVEPPYRWEFVKAIMTDVSASDTMLFPSGGRWWMLTNLDRSGVEDFASELYLFSAESPLSESWEPHPLNPIKIDPEGGRNAGLLRDGDRWFRGGQVHGFGLYGAGLRIYEICTLTPEEYREEMVAEIRPNFRDRMERIHHVSSYNGVTVVDTSRREFVR